MRNYLLVISGAGIGGALRYWLSSYVYEFFPITFPYGTLSVNVLGSFIVGLIIFYLDANDFISAEIRLFLTVGFCGGFTTFSTFSLETVKLLNDSEYLFAALNVGLNLVLCIGAVFLAFLIGNKVS